jgi:hypothetical protein
LEEGKQDMLVALNLFQKEQFFLRSGHRRDFSVGEIRCSVCNAHRKNQSGVHMVGATLNVILASVAFPP